MAAPEPGRKRAASKQSASARKQAPAKKAAKKAPVKQAPLKQAPAKKAPAKATGKKTVASTTAVQTPQVADPPVAVVARVDAPAPVVSGVQPTLVERIVALDWANAIRIAGPAFLVLLAAAGFVATTGLLVDEAPDDVPVFGAPSGDLSVAQFFHAWAAVVALAVGSPITMSASGDGFGLSLVSRAVPLTVTVTVLVAYGGLVRRYAAAATRSLATMRAAMAAVIFALLAMAVSFGARTTIGDEPVVPTDETFGLIEDDAFTQSASPGHAFGWSFLMTAVVGALVVFGPAIIERVRSDASLARLRSWRLPIEGALAALLAAVALGGVAGIASLFAESSDVGGDATDVATALPALLGYFVSIGVFVTGMAMGASVKANLGGFTPDDEAALGYAHLHGLSPAYFLLLVLPVLASLAGIAWMNRRRTDEDIRDLSRAYYRMALPFAVGWAFLAVVSRVEFGAGGLGGVTVGPQVLIGFALALGWSLLVGVSMGQLMLRRGSMPARKDLQLVDLRPAWRPVTVASAAVVVAVAVAGVAVLA